MQLGGEFTAHGCGIPGGGVGGGSGGYEFGGFAGGGDVDFFRFREAGREEAFALAERGGVGVEGFDRLLFLLLLLLGWLLLLSNNTTARDGGCGASDDEAVVDGEVDFAADEKVRVI